MNLIVYYLSQVFIFTIKMNKSSNNFTYTIETKEIIIDAGPYSICACEIAEHIQAGNIVNLEKNAVTLSQSEYANLYDLINKVKKYNNRGHVIWGPIRRYSGGGYFYIDMFDTCNEFNTKVENFYGPEKINVEYNKLESSEMDHIISRLP